MADALLSRLESNAFENTIRIADLGCGTGYLLEQLQRLGFNDLHGFDTIRRRVLQRRNSVVRFGASSKRNSAYPSIRRTWIHLYVRPTNAQAMAKRI